MSVHLKSLIHDNTSLHIKCWDTKCTKLCFKNCHGFHQTSIIRGNTCKLIHKQCHQEKSPQMTPNATFAVLTCTMIEHLDETVVWKQSKLRSWRCWWDAEAFDIHSDMHDGSPAWLTICQFPRAQESHQLISFLQSLNLTCIILLIKHRHGCNLKASRAVIGKNFGHDNQLRSECLQVQLVTCSHPPL